MTLTKGEQTVGRILDGAFEVFCNQSLADTSMATIAETAGVSRPALYQYFADKHDLYGAMLERVLDRCLRRAAGALVDDQPTREALIGFFDRSWGDKEIWLLGRHEAHDLASASASFARPAVEAQRQELLDALDAYLGPRTSSAEQRRGLLDLFRFAPLGFADDRPTRATYRRRLRALAIAMADSIDPVNTAAP